MSDAETPQNDTNVEADGYYGEEELEDGELDLSFLDEDEQDEVAGDAKK